MSHAAAADLTAPFQVARLTGPSRMVESRPTRRVFTRQQMVGAIRTWVARYLTRDGAVYIFWDARHFAPGRARDLVCARSPRSA